MDGVSILTCRCYENVWREAKEQKAISLKLMDEFEKNSPKQYIKKFLLLDNKFYNVCIDCLKETANFLTCEKFFMEIKNKNRGACVLKFKCGEMKWEEICIGCMMFVMNDNNNNNNNFVSF